MWPGLLKYSFEEHEHSHYNYERAPFRAMVSDTQKWECFAHNRFFTPKLDDTLTSIQCVWVCVGGWVVGTNKSLCMCIEYY